MLLDDIYIHGRRYKPWDENYYVSAYGDVYSKRSDIIMKHDIIRTGHHRVRISGKRIMIHRMVYEVWVGPIPDDLLVLHKNDDKDNNHYSNLYLGTYSDNALDAFRNGHRENDRGGNKVVTVRDIKTGEVIEFESIRKCQLELGYELCTFMDVIKLTSSPRFRNRYELISCERPKIPVKEIKDCRKTLVLFDKENGEQVIFESMRDFQRKHGYGPRTCLTLPQLKSFGWFQDRYEVISFGNDVIDG